MNRPYSTRLNSWFAESDAPSIDLLPSNKNVTKNRSRTNEECWVVLGFQFLGCWIGQLIHLSSGNPTEVAFSGSDVIDRHDAEADVLGFVHTHPATRAKPSAVDHATMGAWVSCLGKPLVCGIAGTDGFKAYWYRHEDSKPERMRALKIGNFLIGVRPN